MTDIVERLRQDKSPCRDISSTTRNKLHDDAANEIERLREVLEIISKPTYGTELYDTAYQRPEMYWQHLERFQAIAKKALEK